MDPMCRLCLRSGPDLDFIKDYPAENIDPDGTDAAAAADQSLGQLIFQYLSIQIVKYEPPVDALICDTCRVLIEQWHTFRESCLKNDKIYQQWLADAVESDKPTEMVVEETEAAEEDVDIVIEFEEEGSEGDGGEKDAKGEDSDPNFEVENLVEYGGGNDSDHDDDEDEEYKEQSERSILAKKRGRKPGAKQKVLSNEQVPPKKRGRPRVIRSEVDKKVVEEDENEEQQNDDDQENVEDECLESKTVTKKRGRPKGDSKLGRRADVCTICGKFIKNMAEHMRIHNNEKRHQCPYCPKAFVSASNYNSHVNIHTRAKMYKCDLCEKQYAMLNSLKQHRITHFKERIYLCPVCGKAYYQPTGLARHKRTHFEEPKIKCSKCDKMFLSNADLKKHFTKHLDEKPFSCEICNRAFSRKDNLRTHMKTHRGGHTAKPTSITTSEIAKHEAHVETLICDTCRGLIKQWHTFRLSCLQNDEIYQDWLTSEAIESDESTVAGEDDDLMVVVELEEEANHLDEVKQDDDLTFETEFLVEHDSGERDMNHDDNIGDNNVKKSKSSGLGKKRGRKPSNKKASTKKRGKPKVVGSAAVSKVVGACEKEEPQSVDNLQNVEKEHLNPKPAKKKGRPKAEKKLGKRAFVCPICGKTVKTIAAHMTIHNNDKKYKCPYCPMAFVAINRYNIHVNIHTRAKMYKCDQCEKQYTQYNSLKEHQATHSKERIHACPVCGKTYYQRTTLARHKRRHYQDPTIKCPVCGKMFYSNGELKHHAHIHSGERPYSCDICSWAFKRKTTLATHMKIHQREQTVKPTNTTNDIAATDEFGINPVTVSSGMENLHCFS